MSNKDINYYVYYVVNGQIMYDRTCGAEWAADDRVKTLVQRGRMAFWTFLSIKGAYY